MTVRPPSSTTRQPEVRQAGHQPDLAPGGVPSQGTLIALQQDVLRLDIAVDDAVLVGVVDGLGHLLHESGRRLRGRRPIVQQVLQTAAGDQRHGEKRLVFVLADLEDGHDAGMVQFRGGAGFNAKSGDGVRRGECTGQDHL